MERQGESAAAYQRLFNEESWRDLLPGAVHGPLRQAAEDFFHFAVSTQGDESDEALRSVRDAFSRQLNSDCLNSLGENAPALSQAETDYGVLLMKLASTPSGSGRDGVLRDLTLAREKLIRKEERAPVTTAARSLAEKIGWRGAVGKLQPGSSDERLQAVEQVVLQRLGYQDLRLLFESQTETPQQVLEKFMGKKTEEIASGEPATPEAEVSENIFGKISRWLKGVDWKFVGKGSAAMLGGIGLGELLKFSFFTESLMGSVLLGVNLLLRKVRGAERVEAFIKSREEKYPHASERLLNHAVMATAMGELKAVKNALRVVESPEAMFVGLGISLDAGARSVIAAVGATRRLLETGQAGAGEGGGLPPDERVRAATYPQSPDVAELRGQSPTPGEIAGPQHPGGGRLPGGETAQIPAEDLLTQPGDAELIAAQQAEAATRVVEVQPNDNLTTLVARAGGDAYGADFTNTVLRSADVLTGPQNPNRDMAKALIDFIKAHPGGVNWRDAINGVGDLAKEMVGGVPLKDAIAQATRMIYPGQVMKVVVGAAMP